MMDAQELYLQNLDKFIKQQECLGELLIVGSNDEVLKKDVKLKTKTKGKSNQTSQKPLTQKELSLWRHILINESRAGFLELMEDKLLLHRCNRGMLRFNINFSYEAMEFLHQELHILNEKPLPERFDRLLATTFSLYQHNCWMQKFEDVENINNNLKKLSDAWKNTLMKPNDVLKIDVEYTRPGIEALLEKFGEAVQQSEYLTFDVPQVTIAEPSTSTKKKKRKSADITGDNNTTTVEGAVTGNISTPKKKTKVTSRIK